MFIKTLDENLSIHKDLDDSFSLKKKKNNLSASQMNEIISVRSADMSASGSRSIKSKSESMFLEEEKSNLKKSLLVQLIDNHQDINYIISDEDIPNNFKKLSYNNSNIKNEIKNSSNIKKSGSSLKRSTSATDIDKVETTRISDLKFSNIFIPPLDDKRILQKNKLHNEEKFSEKKRSRDELPQIHGDLKINADKLNRSISEDVSHFKSKSNQYKNFNSSDNKDISNRQAAVNIPSDSISKLQMQNNIISKIKMSINYNPYKDSVKLHSIPLDNKIKNSNTSSYYSSLQKMPGDKKLIKRNSNPKI
jgi:hypothetical protein